MAVNNRKTLNLFWTILGMAIVAVVINLPPQLTILGHTFYRPDFSFKLGGTQFKKDLNLKYGLDLAGGVSLAYDVDTSKTTKDNISTAIESLKNNIERRVNLFGISEATVQISKDNAGKYRLNVDLPGIEDVDSASKLIGQTAQLSFKGENTR
ncbi:MAG: hypothetical protein NTY75_01545 [Candidatus Shapirobacteria bacterium]|nr:hypothetical protein [Candidatus Shapirobacteria bacterium]